MAFNRSLAPSVALTGNALTSALVGIGFNFAASATTNANIEDTLLFASQAGMEKNDLRVLAAVVTWFGVHGNWVNADRLTRIAKGHPSARVRAFWSAIATWRNTDRRFARLATSYRGPRLDLLASGTEFHVRRHGEDDRFAATCLRVPKTILRDRATDIQSPTQLASHHTHYRHRVMMGPSYRADLWAALEADCDLTASELARQTYASFASAWDVRRCFDVLHGGDHSSNKRVATRENTGAATTPPALSPCGSSSATRMTKRGAFAGTSPTKLA
jgi:hypothetical protein